MESTNNSDNCGINSFTNSLNSEHIIAQKTIVFYLATDGSRNGSECQFDTSTSDMSPQIWLDLLQDTIIITIGMNCETACT